MLYSIMLNKKIGEPECFTLCHGLSKFLAASTTMNAQPLKTWILDSRSQQDVVQSQQDVVQSQQDVVQE